MNDAHKLKKFISTYRGRTITVYAAAPYTAIKTATKTFGLKITKMSKVSVREVGAP